MSITNLLSAAILKLDERSYNIQKRGGSSSRVVKNYDRRANIKRNYGTSDRYPATTSQFMRR